MGVSQNKEESNRLAEVKGFNHCKQKVHLEQEKGGTEKKSELTRYYCCATILWAGLELREG